MLHAVGKHNFEEAHFAALFVNSITAVAATITHPGAVCPRERVPAAGKQVIEQALF